MVLPVEIFTVIASFSNEKCQEVIRKLVVTKENALFWYKYIAKECQKWRKVDKKIAKNKLKFLKRKLNEMQEENEQLREYSGFFDE